MSTTSIASGVAVPQPVTKAPASAVFAAAALGGALAALANLAVFALARATGVSFEAKYDPNAPVGPLPLPLVVVASFVPALVAGAVYLGLQKFLRNASKVFLRLAAVLTVLSFGTPLTLEAASFGTKVALNVMHVVAALAITGAILRRARRRA